MVYMASAKTTVTVPGGSPSTLEDSTLQHSEKHMRTVCVSAHLEPQLLLYHLLVPQL